MMKYLFLNKDLIRKAVGVEQEKERKELKLQRNLPVPITQNAAGPIKVCGFNIKNFSIIEIKI
jgi:hypothetical protein